MPAFHNDAAIKNTYVARIQSHADADEIIHGKYWENGKGCAIGCLIHGSDHAKLADVLGVPLAICRLVDQLFEGLPNEKSKRFAVEWLSVIPVGVDLSRVQWKFLHWLLTEELAGREHPLMRDVVRQCADVLVPLTKGELVDIQAAASAARSAAWSAASARSAAWSAASARSAAASAAESAAASAAASAAESAAWSARSAAWSAARSAARSAAWSAASAASAESAESAESAASAIYTRMADQLVKLLAAA
jgi:hypothetical protein